MTVLAAVVSSALPRPASPRVISILSLPTRRLSRRDRSLRQRRMLMTGTPSLRVWMTEARLSRVDKARLRAWRRPDRDRRLTPKPKLVGSRRRVVTRSRRRRVLRRGQYPAER
ncbi:hypothetical protein NEUTE1DRAFT_83009 [Neurospora tetrasperma FGSC 2508]|uniref:Uncharacterized protein n=1 Tax=Neurospora tetrasperma (strain FGSC 2508 / ATCC MYA-4615 / P0657) TaxID=510951 RepID=F8MRE5_NEUT8|nr:uncharacterized protein NEUTE1DRAFT_83009 [Neurospora tetrasperma FGSC 2508]EGO56054.1 hypothetical protein NEUTE1DRAFT_83009 [Neurospora tetrasperma FGSC 2508]